MPSGELWSDDDDCRATLDSRMSHTRLRSTPQRQPREATVIAHQTMTRNRHRQDIGAASLPDSSRRFRQPDATRYLGRGGRRADGNGLQSLPHHLWKDRALNVEREIQSPRRGVHKTNHGGDEPLKRGITPNQVRSRKPTRHISDENIRPSFGQSRNRYHRRHGRAPRLPPTNDPARWPD